MNDKKTSSTIRQLQIVFTISIVILLISSYASYTSINKLNEASNWVNHTNEVRIESEKIISYMKDAETGMRGFVASNNPVFLDPYNGSYEKVIASFNKARELTLDNPEQQKNLDAAKMLIEKQYRQLRTLEQIRKDGTTDRPLFVGHDDELMKGKYIMDSLRQVILTVQSIEQSLLKSRTQDLVKYTGYTPILVMIAAILSIIITMLSYFRIKKDTDLRIAKQEEDEAKYIETSERISVIEGVTGQIASGDYSARSADHKQDEIGRISGALNKMATSLEDNFNDLKKRNWLQTGSANLNYALSGQKHVLELSASILECITSYTESPVATLYVMNDEGNLALTGKHAASQAPELIRPGENLVGQAAKNKKLMLVSELPAGYIQVSSSVGSTMPAYVLIVPLLYSGEVIAVLELGFLRQPAQNIIELLESNQETIAIGINTAVNYKKLQELFEETQAQSEELQSQHGELENVNSELEAQAKNLQASEEELRVQQEELQQTNEELEERTRALEERNYMIAEKNEEVQRKAEELALSAKYKSEFLANMSHELRTPLNSILLLSRLLGDNNLKNLSNDQVEYARVIQSSGNGLLLLIDEILDLSKIEAGKMLLEYEDVSTEDVVRDMKSLFQQVAKEKNLALGISIAKDVPASIQTDKMRLEQVLKNLISNALKFTLKGSVSLHVTKEEKMIRFSVKDTGIGIPEEKQHLIFEAFQQADGSTRRKFGGTGLGLSISRELTRLLGGEIRLTSEAGTGSDFSIFIPAEASVATESVMPAEPEPEKKPVARELKKEAQPEKYSTTVMPENIPDDRDSIKDKDKVILIIEDDTNFAKALIDFSRQNGYKVLSSVRGDEGVELARRYKPLGILLDIQLPVKNGWEVMEDLKSDPLTRHIPVHIMSSHEVKRESLMKGAVDFINKPVAYEQMDLIFKKIEFVLNKNSKKVLIVEENPKHARALAQFLDTFNIAAEVKNTVEDGVSALNKQDIDCVILDMGIPDQKAYDTLEEVKKNPGLENLPIIIFTGKSLSRAEEQKIKRYADSIVVKTAYSYQRILDEVSLFLHLVEENKRPDVTNDYKKSGKLIEVLNNKTVLVVDDDVRNIFSLTKALESMKMKVITAIDGKEALKQLEANPKTDVVLMDMMMPEMDGYETTTRIRGNAKWKSLPVIAVTAKAMTGDREKCINAGASDYITKPVDIDQLLSLLRVWLYDKA